MSNTRPRRPTANVSAHPSMSASPDLACVLGCGTPPPKGGRHQCCPLCHELKLPSTYFCDRNCPAQPWPKHQAWHEEQEANAAGVVVRRMNRALAAEQARQAEDSGSEYLGLMAEAARHFAENHFAEADQVLRKVIALEPGEPESYYNLGTALTNTGRHGEAALSYIQSAARDLPGSEQWADATVAAFNNLQMPECNEPGNEVLKPTWWNDEALKILSKIVIEAADDSQHAHQMRAKVLSGTCPSCKAGPRSAADLREAAEHSERAAELVHAPVQKSKRSRFAAALLQKAAAMEVEEEAKFKAMAMAAEAELETKTSTRRMTPRHRRRR